MHRLQALADLAEGLAQALLQRGLELLVHRVADLLEALAVLFLHLEQPHVHRVSHVLEPLFVGGSHLADVLGHGFAQEGHRSPDLLAQVPAGQSRFLPATSRLLSQLVLEALLAALEPFKAGLQSTATIGCLPAQQHDEQRDGHADEDQSQDR